jgi:hypothetical protein
LRRINRSFHESGQELNDQKSQKALGIHNWTQTGKGIYIRTLCLKNEGPVKIKQRSTKMGWTLPPKGRLLKLGLTHDPNCERCLEKGETATRILCDCEAIAYLRFRHLGQFIIGPSDYCKVLINKDLHFIRSVGLIKG